MGKDEKRHFNGICAGFSYVGARNGLATYRATLRPWLWLLTHSVGNAVHQDMTVPELVCLVFRLNGFTDVDTAGLKGKYEKRELIIQYRESLFNFVSRWMEHEGIFYYFKQEEDRHVLCLADDSTSGSTVANYEELSYRAPTESGRNQEDHFEHWLESARVVADVHAVDSYDFKKPRVNLLGKHPVPQATESELWWVEAPESHLTKEAGDHYAQLHAEELRASKVTFEGSGNVRGLYPSALFTLKDHTRDSFNTRYCVTGAEYVVNCGDFISGGASGDVQFRSHFRAIEANVPFRAARRTPRPVTAGPESAVVVGSEGTEISTEKYGRIRVQFHWDKEHEHNEDSSAWIRVAQPWAGSDFGFQFIPRVGHEVLVDFLNGNPDQPVVIGSVYNDDNHPPFTLSKHRTQSGIRTRSSKGGSKEQYNELRFDDDKGHEEVHLRAERDLSVKVNHDSTANVGHDASQTIKNNLTVTVSEGNYDTFVSKGAMRAEVKDSLFGVTAKEVAVSATEAITLRVGEVSIRIDGMSIALTVDKSAEIKLDLANLSILGTLVNINPPGLVPLGAAKLPDLLTSMGTPPEVS